LPYIQVLLSFFGLALPVVDFQKKPEHQRIIDLAIDGPVEGGNVFK
jgi:hypothetical protein